MINRILLIASAVLTLSFAISTFANEQLRGAIGLLLSETDSTSFILDEDFSNSNGWVLIANANTDELNMDRATAEIAGGQLILKANQYAGTPNASGKKAVAFRDDIPNITWRVAIKSLDGDLFATSAILFFVHKGVKITFNLNRAVDEDNLVDSELVVTFRNHVAFASLDGVKFDEGSILSVMPAPVFDRISVEAFVEARDSNAFFDVELTLSSITASIF